ncbi:hypothetical protein BKK50_04010 [Rodentibacter rarus]|uniref:Uncharacterized protein n=1 Tax=Rodentibacter rarus TaxID=1908260 RepID=A0A1V3INS6_9PAST|nr:hypothetical protein [Rodentibacter rarus]OOF43833.1 hypothetical protein BKK50_04010 [Rodentibacter rarus]
MSIFNINLETCTPDNYRAVYDYLKSKQQTPDELFMSLSMKEIEYLTVNDGLIPENKGFNSLNMQEERQFILDAYPDPSTIKKAIMLTPRAINTAYLAPWYQNGAFDNSPKPPKNERIAVLPFYSEFTDGQTLIFFFGTTEEKGLAAIDPYSGEKIYPKPVQRLTPLLCYLNHTNIIEIMESKGDARNSLFWNIKRASLLVELNSENAKRWQNANKAGLSELFVAWNRLDSYKKDHPAIYPFIQKALMNTRLTSFSLDRFSPVVMATQIMIGIQKYQAELDRQRQESKDAAEDEQKIKEFETYRIKAQIVKNAIDEYRQFDEQCYTTYRNQLAAKEAELNAILKQNDIAGEVSRIEVLPPMTKPTLKVLEEPFSWKDLD